MTSCPAVSKERSDHELSHAYLTPSEEKVKVKLTRANDEASAGLGKAAYTTRKSRAQVL